MSISLTLFAVDEKQIKRRIKNAGDAVVASAIAEYPNHLDESSVTSAIECVQSHRDPGMNNIAVFAVLCAIVKNGSERIEIPEGIDTAVMDLEDLCPDAIFMRDPPFPIPRFDTVPPMMGYIGADADLSPVPDAPVPFRTLQKDVLFAISTVQDDKLDTVLIIQ